MHTQNRDLDNEYQLNLVGVASFLQYPQVQLSWRLCNPEVRIGLPPSNKYYFGVQGLADQQQVLLWCPDDSAT